MAELRSMPQLEISGEELTMWGRRWLAVTNETNGRAKNAEAFDKQQAMNFAGFVDLAFGKSLAEMLGGIPVETPKAKDLIPAKADCVEVGPVRIIGGVRPQNFDAGYRPDGPRVVFDSKTLNDTDSVRKNWQNMINDLGAEATTIHTRFPYAIVAFAVLIPKPALEAKQEHDLIRTLERMGTRRNVIDLPHLAESISLIVWDPATGTICDEVPGAASNLRYDKIPSIIEPIYHERYKGLPPHGYAE